MFDTNHLFTCLRRGSAAPTGGGLTSPVRAVDPVMDSPHWGAHNCGLHPLQLWTTVDNRWQSAMSKEGLRMTHATTTGWVPLWVRLDDYERFASQVALLEKERHSGSANSSHTTPSSQQNTEDPLAWPESALHRLAEGTTMTTQRWTKAMDACSEVPGEWLTTTEVADHAGMSKNDWRDAPRKLSAHLRQHFPDVPIDTEHNKEAWPMHAKTFPGDGQVSWSITPEMARRWKNVRSAN